MLGFVSGISVYFQWMKIFTLLLFIFTALHSRAQNDFLLLKKHNKTIAHYFKGDAIGVYTKDCALINGILKKCSGDTLYINIPVTQNYATIFGNAVDTTGYNYFKINVQDVAMIPAQRLNATTIGNIIVRAGVLITSIWAVNKIHINGNRQNTYAVQFLAAGAVNVAAAYAAPFKNSRPTGYKIGRKFKLVYISM